MTPSEIDHWLLDCLRPEAATQGTRSAKHRTDTDWDALLEQAARHAVTPLLYHRLKTLHPEQSIPPAITGKLRQATLDNSARNLRLYHNLGTVLKRLRRDDIPVIALKGAYLAECVYSNRALRFMGDLDLLVKQDDLMKVDALLLEMGCTPTVHNRIVGTDNNEFVYVMPRRDVSLEIHWLLFPPQLPFSLDTAGQWERSRPALIAGVEVSVLCPEDLLLHLCLHAGCTHGFEPGLKLFCDISEILHCDKERLDWPLFQHLTRDCGAEKCVYLTLRLTRDLLGVTLPDGILEALKPADFDEHYVALAKDQVFSRSDRSGPPLSLWPAVAQFWGATRLRDKVALFLKGFFIPRAAMARIYPVPANSLRIYFYYPVRLKDLLRTYGRDVWRWLRRDQSMKEMAKAGKDLTTLKDWLTTS